MVKPNVVYPYHRTLHCNKKERTIDTCNDLGESQGNHAKWKNIIPKCLIPNYVIPFIEHVSNEKNFRNGG